MLRNSIAHVNRHVASISNLHRVVAPVRLASNLPRLPPRPKIDENDITENFIKGGGAGGQKINKTNSQVQLIHHPSGINIRCQETRSRAQNRVIARRVLAERLEDLEKGDQSRSALKAQRAVKKKANASKKSRRKYAKLADENASAKTTSDSDTANVDAEEEHGPTTGSAESADSTTK